jgi:hypothetical protein
VIALRHTTERQVFGVIHASYVVDSIDYKGAGPMQVIRSRIADAIASPAQAFACLADTPKARATTFLRQLAFNLQKDRVHLSLLLQNLSGASVRKGLVYAHSLLCNGIYDPTLRATISEGDMMRAIIVGSHRWYEQSPEQLTCNLFQVYNRHLRASFLKLRALRALHVQSETALEMTLGALVEYLQMFGYSERMIRAVACARKHTTVKQSGRCHGGRQRQPAVPQAGKRPYADRVSGAAMKVYSDCDGVFSSKERMTQR